MKDEWLTIAAAAQRLSISERQTRRYAGQVPDTDKRNVSGTLLVNLSALSRLRESKSKHKAPEVPDIRTPNAGHAPDTSNAQRKEVERLESEVSFLRGLVEQHQRSEAELRAALREALKAMPKALEQGNAIEAPKSPEIAPDVVSPIKSTKPPQKPQKREKMARPLWKVLLGVRL
jgi:predicted RNase H-like nuclease (RuvC/YqgF family)